jgi:hypothetical protein
LQLEQMIPNPSPDERRQARLQQLYEQGVQLLLGGVDDRALECFKEIYEVDYAFRDIATIVEDSYVDHDWATKHRNRLRSHNGG